MSQPSAVRSGQRGTLLIGPFSVLMPCPTWTLTWNTDTASRLLFLPQDFWYRYHNLANSHETESLSARLEIKNTCSIFKNVFNERSRRAFYYPLLNCTIGTLNRHQKEIRIRSGSEISPWILDDRAHSCFYFFRLIRLLVRCVCVCVCVCGRGDTVPDWFSRKDFSQRTFWPIRAKKCRWNL